MAQALASVRGEPPTLPGPGAATAGLLKYGASTLAGALAATLCARLHWSAAVVGGVVAFYAAEAQGVFVFPGLAAGSSAPWRESRGLVVSAGGTAAVMARTVLIAVVMLFGGVAGRGFLRSWCVGCLAVVIWYERLRR
jgi:hypothetical protein